MATVADYANLFVRLEALSAQLDEASGELMELGRELHTDPWTEVIPQERQWMVSHLFYLQDGLRGATNHLDALQLRLERRAQQEHGEAF